jgi:hypothetical protein
MVNEYYTPYKFAVLSDLLSYINLFFCITGNFNSILSARQRPLTMA